jgi:hypothetical protein
MPLRRAGFASFLDTPFGLPSPDLRGAEDDAPASRVDSRVVTTQFRCAPHLRPRPRAWELGWILVVMEDALCGMALFRPLEWATWPPSSKREKQPPTPSDGSGVPG